jgi:hypothetical protein
MGARSKVSVHFERECVAEGRRRTKGTIANVEAPIAAMLVDAVAARQLRTQAEHQYALMAARGEELLEDLI